MRRPGQLGEDILDRCPGAKGALGQPPCVPLGDESLFQCGVHPCTDGRIIQKPRLTGLFFEVFRVPDGFAGSDKPVDGPANGRLEKLRQDDLRFLAGLRQAVAQEDAPSPPAAFFAHRISVGQARNVPVPQALVHRARIGHDGLHMCKRRFFAPFDRKATQRAVIFGVAHDSLPGMQVTYRMNQKKKSKNSMLRYVASVGVLAMGLLLPLSSSVLAEPASCPQFGVGGQLPTLVDPKLAPRTTLLCNEVYASLNSGLVHEPLWSAEHLTRTDIEQARDLGRITERFHADPRLPPGDGAELSDYRRSGYDRGHMTPSGEAPDAVAQEQTFSLANVVPQTPELNEGIWTGVEMAVRKLATREGELYVVTGPAFHGSTQGIGRDVFVPTSTWKAVYDPVTNGAGVYVCKNNEQPTCAFVSVATLIRVVGVDPFPALPDDVKANAMPLPEPEASPYHPRTHRPLSERGYGFRDDPMQ